MNDGEIQALCRGINGLNRRYFLRAYKSCMRAALAAVMNDPPTRAQKNESLNGLSLIVGKLISKLDEKDDNERHLFNGWNRELTTIGAQSVSSRRYIEYFLKSRVNVAIAEGLITSSLGLKLVSRYKDLHDMTKTELCLKMNLRYPDRDLLSSMISASESINTGQKTKGREPFFWIEQRVGQEFLIAGGKIKQYEKGDFAKILRLFRRDCGARTSLSPDKVGRARIVDLLEHLYEERSTPETGKEDDPVRRALSNKW